MAGRGGYPRLLLITSPATRPDALASLLPSMRGLADAVLLRWPQLDTAEVFARTRFLVGIQPRPRLLVSARVDVAVEAGADGVQLRDDGIDPQHLRTLPQVPEWIGVSRHAATVRAEPHADFVVLAPIFPPHSKRGTESIGLDALRAAVRTAAAPVLALGGIDPGRVSAVLEAGAAGVACCGFVFGDPDPVARLGELRRELDRSLNA